MIDTCCTPSGVLYVQELNSAANDVDSKKTFLIRVIFYLLQHFVQSEGMPYILQYKH